MPIPAPLTSGHLCPDCKGTGADRKKTLARDRREPSAGGYIRCRPCKGNGLDPTKYFRWGPHPVYTKGIEP